MKLPALILAGSLVANAALVAVYFTRSPASSKSPAPPDSANGDATASAANPALPSRPKPPAGKSFSASTSASPTNAQTWGQLNSTDLRALTARLRAAGFPSATIRAIVAAQVADQLRPKVRDLADGLELKPFWATNRDFGYDPKVAAAMRDLYRESARLTKEALGPDFPDDNSDVSDNQRRRYGNLPKDKIDQLQRVTDDYAEMRNQTMTAAGGLMLPEDREKLALLEKEKRADLARLLGPQDLDDFLMRTSSATSQLRTALTTMNASEAEFRTIFQVKQDFEDKHGFQAMGGYMSADRMKERTTAQQQVAEQLRAALGEARYVEYARGADREFQSITRLAQQANLPNTAAIQAYNLRDTASKESNRIHADAALTTDQKRAALQTLAQTTRTQLTATLGADAGSSYLKVADRWLSSIERGAAIIFTETGSTTTRNLPPQRPANTTLRPDTATPAAPVTTKTGG